MLDLNRPERRALSAAVFLVGLSALSRSLLVPSGSGAAWERLHPEADAASPRAGVSAAVAREARALTPLEAGEKIDVSTAPAEELRRLPGVGPSLAEAIIRERASRPFGTVDDLDRVPGIGPTTLSRLRERVSVGIPAARPPAERAREGGCGPEGVAVNTASADRLQSLPGIGPAIARRVIEHRERNGPFVDAEALDAVRGIGPALLARIAPSLCFE